MKAYIYILRDENNKFYIGSTPNLEQRLKQHSYGYMQTTRNMRHPKLVLKQEVASLLVARRIERKLKKLRRKDYVEKIVADGFIKMSP